MTLVTPALRKRAIEAPIVDWVRILASEHCKMPTGAGFGASRFSSPSKAFRVLYAGVDFSTAFAEAVVRDRFQGKQRRYLYRPHLEQLCIAEIGSSRKLRLLDLRGAAAYEAGVDTDASRARLHTPGQELSEAVYKAMPGIDGILFSSRLTTGDCVAIYDRALPALTATSPIDLLRCASLSDELARLEISLRNRRGFGRSSPVR